MAKLLADAKSSYWILAVMIMFLLRSSSSVLVPLPLPLPRNKFGEYEFLELVMQWAPSYCNTEAALCEEIPEKFTISRFSPMYYPHMIVPPFNGSGCELWADPVELEEDDMRSISRPMQTDWPSLEGDHFKLWKKHWETYGGCFGTPRRPRSFFLAGLNLGSKVDVLGILSTSTVKPDGIKPALYEPYDAGKVRLALEKALQVKTVNIICNKDAGGTIQLFQVRVCFGKDQKMQACEPVNPYDALCDLAPDGIAFPTAPA